MNGELKACPFCGGSARIVREMDSDGFGAFYAVACGTCRASSGNQYASNGNDCPLMYGEVRDKWNTRPTPAPGALPELIESRLRYLERFSDEGQHKSIPGPYAGPAWELAQDLRMAIPAYASAYAEQCCTGVWLPIDSAPKDELILVGPTKRMGICAAMNHSRDGWVTETTSEWYPIYEPSHWMPLPAPPTLQSAFADDEGVKK